MNEHVEAIDRVTNSFRRVAELLRAATSATVKRDESWLIDMALEAVEEGEPAIAQLNDTNEPRGAIEEGC